MKRAQTSVELIAILSMVLGIFLVIYATNVSVMDSFSSVYKTEKMKTSLNEIAAASELVYQQGQGAKTRVYIALPSGINGYTVAGQTINYSINMQGENRTFFKNLDFSVQGELPANEGEYWVNVEAITGAVSFSLHNQT